MCSSKYLSKKRWVCCGAGHAIDKSIRFCVPGKTRNCKTFEKSCDSCNRIQNVFVSARSIFTVFSWAYQLSIQHLHEHWTWLNGQLISPLYFFTDSELQVCWEINGDQFKLRPGRDQCSLYQFNESNSEIDGRANDTTLFKSFNPGSIWNVNSFLIQFLFMWWYINFTDNTTLDFMFAFTFWNRGNMIIDALFPPYLLFSHATIALSQ